MSTRSRRRSGPAETEAYDDEFGLVTDDDIAAYMAEVELEEEAEEEKSKGFWNLQTASGMGLIGVGALYSLQQLGLLGLGLDLSWFVGVLPIFAAVLIMLTGFGVLSWSPAARRRRKARKRAARRRSQRKAQRRRSQPKTVGRRARSDESGDAAARAFEQAREALGTAGRTAGRAANRAYEEARARRAKARRAGRTRLVKDRANRKVTGVAAGMANYFGLDPTVVRIAWVVASIFSQGAAVLVYIILSVLLDNDDEDDDDPVVVIRG